MTPTVLITIGMAALVALVLLALKKPGRYLVIGLLALGGLGLLGVLLVNGAANYRAATAAQSAARAAAIASAGQTVAGLVMTLAIGALLAALLTAGLVIAYLLIRVRIHERQLEQSRRRSGQWVSGPNAQWRQVTPPPVAYPQVPPPTYPIFPYIYPYPPAYPPASLPQTPYRDVVVEEQGDDAPEWW